MESKKIICDILIVIYNMRTENRITEFLKLFKKHVNNPDVIDSNKFNLKTGSNQQIKYS